MQPDPQGTTETDLRAATRITCDVPVLLDPGKQRIPARMVDVSRTGVRLRIADEHLLLHRLSTIRHVAERLSATIGGGFEAHFHPEMLGALVSRNLSIVRIASRDWEQTSIEVGCVIENNPFRDEEAGMLGLALPLMGTRIVPDALASTHEPTTRLGRFEGADEIEPTAAQPEVAPEEHQDDPRIRPGHVETHRNTSRFRVAITSSSKLSRVPPLRGLTEGLSPQRGRIRVTDLKELGFTKRPTSVASVVLALDERYGEYIALKLSDGAKHLWSGPARVTQVELPPDRPGQALIDVCFERTLRPAERKKLGM